MKATVTLKLATTLATLSGLGLAAATPVLAQNTYKIASIEGGSSAFLGSFGTGTGFAQGALPQIIRRVSAPITGYKAKFDVDEAILASNVTLSDGTITETAGAAEILFNSYNNGGTPESTSDYRVIVLLRTDSGFGVRYITNGFKIVSYGAFTDTSGTAITPSATGTVSQQVANFLTVNQNTSAEKITAGLSDVSGDTTIRYANFPGLAQTGLKLKNTRVGILTLLPLYSGGMATGQADFTRNQFRSLVGGTGSGINGLTSVFYREQTSGTRNTEVVSVQAKVPAATVTVNGVPHLVYTAEAGGTLVTGTGAMLTGLNTTANSFGYAFVTGTAGVGKTNVLIGSYGGVDPVGGGTTSGSAVAIPAYTSAVPYKGVANGTYTLWSYEQLYENPSALDTTAESIGSALGNTSNAGIVHQQGILQLSDKKVSRDSYSSVREGTTGRDELIYDGQTVTVNPVTKSAFPGTPQP